MSNRFAIRVPMPDDEGIMWLERRTELRKHPFMSYRGVSNWPPLWIWNGGGEGVMNALAGEIGILLDVRLLQTPPPRFDLIIEHNSAQYAGRLLFDNAVFCLQIYRLLQMYRHRPIREIGQLDISHLF